MIKFLFRQFIVIKTKIEIRYNNRCHFRIFKRILRLGFKIIHNQKNGLIWDDNDDFSKIIIVSLAKNLQRLQSILILCKRGLAKDAIPLLRIMFEELIDLKYMNADKNRINDYLDYDIYIRIRLGKILADNNYKGINKEKIVEKIKELEKEWDKIKNRFTKKDGHIYKRWTRENVREISKIFKLEESYSIIFGYLSNYIHSNPLSAGDYILGRDEKGIIVEIGTSPEFVREVLRTASMLFVGILTIVNNKYKMNLEEKIEKLSIILEKDNRYEK